MFLCVFSYLRISCRFYLEAEITRKPSPGSAPAAPIPANRRPPPGQTLGGDPARSCQTDPHRLRQPCRSRRTVGRHLVERLEEIRPEPSSRSAPTAPAVPILDRHQVEHLKEIRPGAAEQIRADCASHADPGEPSAATWSNAWRRSDRKPPSRSAPTWSKYAYIKRKDIEKNTPTVSGGGLGGTVARTVLASERKPDKDTKKSNSGYYFS